MIATNRFTFSQRMQVRLPNLTKLPAVRAPVIAPRLEIVVIVVIQNLSSSGVQPLRAEKVDSRLPHEDMPYPNWNIPMLITRE